MIPSAKNCIVVAALLVLLIVGCRNFYKATPGRTGAYAAGTLDSARLQNRHFVLRNGAQALYMKNTVISADRTTVSCLLDTLPPEHKLHLVQGRGGNFRYKKTDLADAAVLTEVHLYTDGTLRLLPGETISLPLEKVQKIEVIEKDKKRTTNSYVIGAVGYTLGAAVVAMGIIVATKSSCPFVSAYDGEQFVLQGEIYGGAIYPQLARPDFLPLKMAPTADGLLQLKISNELMERQYTDAADLWVVTHAKNTQVLADESGSLHSVSAPQPPIAATLNGRKNLLPMLAVENDHRIAYMDDSTTADAGNAVHLSFKKQSGAANGRLVLTLKNGYWLDLLYGELAKGFGNYYETYLKKQAKKPAGDLQRWIKEQQIPLTVSVRDNEGWKKVAGLTTVGPLAYRKLVVPVDLSGVGETVDIRLSSGFLFWEIDYAALDFSNSADFFVETLSPIAAVDQTGADVLPVLKKEDGRHLAQPFIGNVATVSYRPAARRDVSKTQTFILRTKGWYQHVRNFSHSPNLAFLKRFRQPSALPLYGKELYKQFQTEKLLMAAN